MDQTCPPARLGLSRLRSLSDLNQSTPAGMSLM